MLADLRHERADQVDGDGVGAVVVVAVGRVVALSVTQVGSPEKSWSYSGVRRKRTMRSLMTKSSLSSCARSSVIRPPARSRLR